MSTSRTIPRLFTRYNDRVRRLIINADDFGLTPGVNRAIVESHGHGVVTSATLMANAAAFPTAVSLAGSCPRLSVGCHVVLIDGTPVSPAEKIPTLAERDPSGSSHFRDGLATFAARAFSGKISSQEVEEEATAQIRKLQSSGIAVSHLDTHKHTHMFPASLRPLLSAARACGVPAIRNPFTPVAEFPLALLKSRPNLWKRSLEVRALRSLRSTFRRLVREAGLTTPDGSFGIVATGSLDLPLFEAIVQSIPEGTWELVCHPGYNDSDLTKATTRLLESRSEELKLLTSSAAREALARKGVDLISYRELAANA